MPFPEDFSNSKLLPQVLQRSHYPNFLTTFYADLRKRDETEVWLRLITLIEMQQSRPCFAEDEHEGCKSELHTVPEPRRD